jgi:hypothetical protein
MNLVLQDESRVTTIRPNDVTATTYGVDRVTVFCCPSTCTLHANDAVGITSQIFTHPHLRVISKTGICIAQASDVCVRSPHISQSPWRFVGVFIASSSTMREAAATPRGVRSVYVCSSTPQLRLAHALTWAEDSSRRVIVHPALD